MLAAITKERSAGNPDEGCFFHYHWPSVMLKSLW